MYNASMLDSLARRAAKAGADSRIETRLAIERFVGCLRPCRPAGFCVGLRRGARDASAERFFAEAAQVLKAGSNMLSAAPRGYVKPDTWTGELAAAAKAGLPNRAEPQIRRSLAVLLEKA